MDLNSWAEVKRFTICDICKKSFEKPHTLICRHTFCELCINRRDIKKCPSCPDNRAINKLIPFNVVCFENHYISRLTIVFRNKVDVLEGRCSVCKTDSYICSNCYFVGCRNQDCQRNQSCEDKLTNHNFFPVDLNNTPETLLQCTLEQVCTTHPDSEITKYCYTCHKNECRKCLANHKNPNCDTMQSIKEKLLKYLSALECHGNIQQTLYQKAADLEQRKEDLHKLYVKQYTLTEKEYDQKIHSLCQLKQVILSRLRALWSITDRAVESYKAEIQDLQKLANEFYVYFKFLIENSSHKETTAYFIKGRRQHVVENIVKVLEEAIVMIQRELGSYLKKSHIEQKFTEQKETVKRKSFVCKDLSAVAHSMTGNAFKEEYQHLNCEDKLFKLEQIQVNVLGEEHSMFTMPLASSKVVHTTKHQIMEVSKCAQCLSQLHLFSRVLGKNPDLNQKQIVLSLNNYLLNSNKELFSVTTDAINGIKTAIMHLQIKDYSLYCKELNKNLDRLDFFIKKSNDYYLELEVFYFGQQKLHINSDQTAVGKSSVIYVSMLLDILMDCRAYITNIRQICENLFSIQKPIEILCNEGHKKESHENFKKLIASHGFQLQIVLHYSNWIALNEICKTTADLIASWNLERALFSNHT